MYSVKAMYLHPHVFLNSWYTLWLFNIAMENDPFIDDSPIHTSIYKGFSMAMLNNQPFIDYFTIKTSIYNGFSMAMLNNQRVYQRHTIT